MRLRNLLVAAGVLALALAMVTGCDSDNNNVNNPLTPGDQNDPSFQFVQDNAQERAFDGTDFSFSLSTQLFDSIPGVSPVRGQVAGDAAWENGDFTIQSYSYQNVGTWHIFNVSGYLDDTVKGEIINLVAIDSIQITANGQVLSQPDPSMDGFNTNMHFDAWGQTTNDSTSSIHRMQLQFLSGSVLQINGVLSDQIRFTYTDAGQSCDCNMATTFTASGVQFDLSSGGCPDAGNIGITATMSFDCPGGGPNPWSLSLNGTWTITGTFNGVTESYTYTNGGTVWTASEPCGPSPVGFFGF